MSGYLFGKKYIDILVDRHSIILAVTKETTTKERYTSPTPEDLARQKVMELWKDGNLFCNFAGHPPALGKNAMPSLYRLLQILNEGLSPTSLLGCGGVPADGTIHLRRYRGSESHLHKTPLDIYVFIDSDLPVSENEGMTPNWTQSSPDEVYWRGMILPDQIRGIAAHWAVASAAIYPIIQPKLREHAIPLYNLEGKLIWPWQD